MAEGEKQCESGGVGSSKAEAQGGMGKVYHKVGQAGLEDLE